MTYHFFDPDRIKGDEEMATALIAESVPDKGFQY